MERFDAYVERCLYDPVSGFYASGRGAAGRRRGDFITSPEVGPLFGAVLANAIDTWWAELGQPDPLVVIDAGSGPGTLLRTIERANPVCGRALTMLGVDRATGVELPADLTGAVVIANELLDNIGFRQLVASGGRWLDVYIASDGSEALVDDGADLALEPVDGFRVPLLSDAAAWVEEVMGRGAERLVAFDYGVTTTAELAERGGWLRTYRDHRREADPYLEPGEWDITCDVAFDQLPPPSRLRTQTEFLTEHGIDDLVALGSDYWSEHSHQPDLEAILMRSRSVEVEALMDPVGLGGWLCAEWTRPAGSQS